MIDIKLNKMELKVHEKFTDEVNPYSESNIGWNNFDPDVKNGYKFKPNKNWQGSYYFLYFKINNKIIATTDNTLTNIPKIDEVFEKFFCKKEGTIDRVELSDDFKILRYKTWSCGEASEWINY